MFSDTGDLDPLPAAERRRRIFERTKARYARAGIGLDETRQLPIGSHLSVPIRLGDGTVYGAICCFSSDRMPTLTERDLKTLGLVADLIATQIDNDAPTRRLYAETIEAIRTAILAAEPNMVYQPILELTERKVFGAEALSRFSKLPYRAPDRWFADTGTVGVRSDLEMVAIRNAVADTRRPGRPSLNYICPSMRQPAPSSPRVF